MLPFFSIKFLDEVSKDGDIVRFKIRVKKLTAPLDDMESDVALVIEREYEDFQFLHHVLTTHNQVSMYVSMTSLLVHTVAQSIKWRFLPKNLSQLVIFVIGLAFTWV